MASFDRPEPGSTASADPSALPQTLAPTRGADWAKCAVGPGIALVLLVTYRVAPDFYLRWVL